jgi:hypothetical protein
MTLDVDDVLILNVLAERGPMTVRDLIHVLEPVPCAPVSAQFDAWAAGRIRFRAIDGHLVKTGLVEAAAGSRRITEAGTAELARITGVGRDGSR